MLDGSLGVPLTLARFLGITLSLVGIELSSEEILCLVESSSIASDSFDTILMLLGIVRRSSLAYPPRYRLWVGHGTSLLRMLR